MLRRGSMNYVLLSFFLDVICTLGAVSLAAQLRVAEPLDETDLHFIELPGTVILLTVLIWAVVFIILSVYDEQRNYRAVDEFQRVILASLFALLVQAGALYFSYRDIPRLFVVYFFVINVTLLTGWRLVARWIFRTVRGTYNQRNVLIVGCTDLAKQVALAIQQYGWCGLTLVGFVNDEINSPITGLPVLGDYSDVRRIVEEHDVKEVVIALPYNAYEHISSLVYNLQAVPVNVRVIPNYVNLALHHATVETFGGLPLINLREPALSEYQRLVKRVFDLVFSLILIILTLPTMIVLAIAIKLDSPGPIFFKQKRVGENGHLFHMYKFRSMVADAEQRQAEVIKRDAAGNIIHKSEHDPRITRVGAFIRRTSLDELPQLFNVFLGSMSLVGPRPELPWLVAQYEPWQHKRFAVPQGITGWWQVNGRSTKPMHLSTEDDLYYIQNYSLLLDLWILWKTVAVVLKRQGAF